MNIARVVKDRGQPPADADKGVHKSLGLSLSTHSSEQGLTRPHTNLCKGGAASYQSTMSSQSTAALTQSHTVTSMGANSASPTASKMEPFASNTFMPPKANAPGGGKTRKIKVRASDMSYLNKDSFDESNQVGLGIIEMAAKRWESECVSNSSCCTPPKRPRVSLRRAMSSNGSDWLPTSHALERTASAPTKGFKKDTVPSMGDLFVAVVEDSPSEPPAVTRSQSVSVKSRQRSSHPKDGSSIGVEISKPIGRLRGPDLIRALSKARQINSDDPTMEVDLAEEMTKLSVCPSRISINTGGRWCDEESVARSRRWGERSNETNGNGKKLSPPTPKKSSQKTFPIQFLDIPCRGVERDISDVSNDSMFNSIKAAGVTDEILDALAAVGLTITETACTF
jgi:hypothetical protein